MTAIEAMLSAVCVSSILMNLKLHARTLDMKNVFSEFRDLTNNNKECLLKELSYLRRNIYKIEAEIKLNPFERNLNYEIKNLKWQIKNPPKYKEGDIHKIYGRIIDVKFEENKWRYFTKNANFVEN